MKLNYRRTFFIGLAFMSICAFWQLYENIVPLILKNTFEFKDGKIGVIMALDNVVALFLLPLFGTLSDKFNSKWGKRTPFIVAGTIVSAALMMLLPIADQQKNIALFLIALCAVLLSMGTYRSPAVALMPDVTLRANRSQANAIINLMGAGGGILTLGLIKVLVIEESDGRSDYIPVFAGIALIMLLAIIILCLTIKEPKLVKEVQEQEKKLCQRNATQESDGEETDKSQDKQGEETAATNVDMKPVKKSLLLLLMSVFLWFTAYNAVTTAFSRYVDEVWNMGNKGFTNFLLVAMGAAILSYIPIGFISARVGRKKTILTGIIMITCSYLMGCFFTHYSPLIYFVFILTGFGWAAINVNSYPMVVEMSQGNDVGKYTGYYYSFSMTAQVVTPILSGLLLEHVSYYTLFPYAVFFSVASFITMLLVKHGDVKPIQKKSILENFDVED